jgi:hypothetical protein
MQPRLGLLGYRTEVVMLDSDQFYWHVWRHRTRVNGGLSESWGDACDDAEYAAVCDWNSIRLRRTNSIQDLRVG